MNTFVRPRENGVDFDEDGPKLGPIRLLSKSRLGFLPRPANELDLILSQTLDQSPDLEILRSSLENIAQHMNSGEMAIAAIATGYLSLPPLSEAQCQTAQGLETLLKASPDDPKHPRLARRRAGWPRR